MTEEEAKKLISERKNICASKLNELIGAAKDVGMEALDEAKDEYRKKERESQSKAEKKTVILVMVIVAALAFVIANFAIDGACSGFASIAIGIGIVCLVGYFINRNTIDLTAERKRIMGNIEDQYETLKNKLSGYK